ncbi:MAG: DNA-3-methyladenine glycosylase [Firmicutes bacterium]|nr:DNA-3-methyladenine glycosylase [Bacillota bacterium]
MFFVYGERELNHLRTRDKKLGAVIDRVGMIKREVNPDIFSALVESVVSQQISSKAADTVCGKLSVLCGMKAQRLHSMPVEEIKGCGMSMRKAEYIKNIADAAVNRAVDFTALADKSDNEIIEILTALKGVGVWTAEMLLIFSLMRPDVVSYGDLAIKRGMMRLYMLSDLSKEHFNRYAKRYSPYGSVASLYLWHLSVEDADTANCSNGINSKLPEKSHIGTSC